MIKNSDCSEQLILVIAGTRPEVIKLAPIVKALRETSEYSVFFLSSGQQGELLGQTLQDQDIQPDVEIDWGARIRSLRGDFRFLMASLLNEISTHFGHFLPRRILVQGDTLTSLAGARVARRLGVQLIHLEAGLRSYDLAQPFPEEITRRLISRWSKTHLTPDLRAAHVLQSEGICPSDIHIVGNPALDGISLKRKTRPLVLVTLHRRELFGTQLQAIFETILDVARTVGSHTFVIMRHSNPRVEKELKLIVSRLPKNVLIVDPMPRERFLELVSESELVLTDSGGVQEETAALLIPTLIVRNVLDRQDGTLNGIVQKIGTHPGDVRAHLVSRLNPEHQFSAKNTRGLELNSGYGPPQVPRLSASECVLNALRMRTQHAGPGEGRGPGELADLIDNLLLTHVVNNRGDVAGEFTEGLIPGFFYPEIAGYYLSWLARANRRYGLRAKMLAINILQRLARFESTPPPTRYGQIGISVDWRAGGIFLFDLAMIARGLADCYIAFQGVSSKHSGTSSMFDVINRVQVGCWLEPFLAFRQVAAPALINRHFADLPVTWSTKPGPYQMKVFAALEHYATTFDHPDWLAQARGWASDQLESLPVHPDCSENMIHPGFYCCEGLLGFGKFDLAARLAKDLVFATHQMLASGVVTRLDIHAQALRFSMLFDPGSKQTNRLYQTMDDRIRPFLDTGSPGSARATIWGLIFASEALRLVSKPVAGPHVVFT